jgi:fatty-acyl-CoA synthase
MIGIQTAIRAARDPDKVAVYFGARHLTYRALDQRAGALATALAARGIGRGDRVAGLLTNCPQFLELVFAIARLGAIFVPVNFRLAAPEVAQVLNACTPALLFAGQDFGAMLAGLRAAGDLACPIITVNDRPDTGDADAPYEALLTGAPLEPVAAASDEPLLLMHSSGTTGLPKGAIHTYGTVMASCMIKTIDFRITSDDRAVTFGPLFHAGPLFDLTLPALLRGGSVVLGVSRNFDAEVLLRTVAEHRGTVAPVYPTMLRRVMANGLGTHDLRSWRLIITGGEAIAPSLLRQVQQALPHTEIINNYGSTEGGPITTFLPGAEAERKESSVGRPSFGMQVRLADDAGYEVPVGTVGEVTVRGPLTCAGYWNRPDLTAAARRGPWWATGDLGRFDEEGYLWIVGRRTDMIKSGTESVYPGEVENVITTLPGVVEVGVVGVPDPDWGEAVAAFIVAAPGSGLDADAVVRHCRPHLAGYKLPRHVHFIDALPRSGGNKISRRDLAARFETETNV